MSTRKLHSVDKILDGIKNVENIPTDAKLADFLGVQPGTISAWRSRDSLDWKLILAKCSDYIEGLLYDSDDDIVQESESTYSIKRPTEIWPDDPVLAEFERRVDELVDTIMHGPFSRGLKIRLIESLLQMSGQELGELQKQSDPSNQADDNS